MIVFSLISIFLPFQDSNTIATKSQKEFEFKFEAYIERAPIIITHDDNFTLYPITGIGTPGDPYRIENFNITSDLEEIAISISHTTKHFIIKNCYLRPTTTGIYLNDVTQGTAQIVDNIVEGISVSMGEGFRIVNTNSTFLANNTYLSPLIQSAAFDLDYAHHTIVFNNTAWDDSGPSDTSFLQVLYSESVIAANNSCDYSLFGINYYEGFNAIVENNSFVDCSNAAIQLYKCPQSIIHNNFLDNCGIQAMEIHDSPANITDNIITNKGFRITNEHKAQYRLYKVENNIVSGKAYGYFIDTPDLIINTNVYGQIFAFNCSNMKISNLDANDVSFVIFLRDCLIPLITDCTFSYSSYPAILLQNCTSPYLTNNYFSYCEQGLNLGYTNDSIIEYNTFIYQFWEAIIIDSSHNNTITYNLFQQGSGGVELYQYTENNHIHHNTFQNCYAYDDGFNNTWYDPVAQEGNYWWDYSGSGNYTIWGSARANDTYPLGSPPVPIIPEFDNDLGFTFLLLLIPVIVLIPYIRKRKK